MKKSLFFAAALLALVACTREVAIDSHPGDMTITARTETSADTKTVVEGGTHVYWEPGDEIKVFAGGKSGKFTTDISASSASATFNGTLGEDAWTEGMDLWAVYPYSKDAVFSDGTITAVLPSEQVARAGSFGKDMNLAIAHSTTSDLQFYNVGGGIRFTLSQDGITEVVLEGLKGETLAGKVKVGIQDGKPVIQEVIEGQMSITITPSENETFKKDIWYYIVSIPGTLEKGFKLTFLKGDAQESRIFEKPVEIKRGIWGSISSADKEPGTPSSLGVVDLGLPSGLKWASCNLGASAPEEWGDYFAWGETEPYYEEGLGYGQSGDERTTNPVWKQGKEAGYNWPSYKWCMGTNNTLTKYCARFEWGADGFTDNKIILDPEDDAAHVILGDKWRMPTVGDFSELLENCSYAKEMENGVTGYRLTSLINGQSVFFPAAGVAGYEDLLLDNGINGYYWSSSIVTPGEGERGNSNYAFIAFFLEKGLLPSYDADRPYGCAIRPVYGESIPVEDISLDKTELEIGVAESILLTANILPKNATFKSVTWSTSDKWVADVSSTGVVTGVDAGSAVITATTVDGGKKATCKVTVKGGALLPDIIDLGLPSGLKWASKNLGASLPEKFGDYFAWGEIEPYYEPGYALAKTPIWKPGKGEGYYWSSYRWSVYAPFQQGYRHLTKYTTDPDYAENGITDWNTVLDPEDDAAHVILGGKWRMPTYEELMELCTVCSWAYTERYGVGGAKVTGPNGNSIFLPGAGYRYNDKIYLWEQYCHYWSSSLNVDYPIGAHAVFFYPMGLDETRNGASRSDGLPIRPVWDDNI